MKSNYRIRSEIIPQFNYHKPHIPGNEIKPATVVYHVDRRFLWFWWIPVSVFASTFTKYEDAVYFIEIVRDGKILFTI